MGAQAYLLKPFEASELKRVMEAAEVAPGKEILEIGCGWGGFAEYAAASESRMESMRSAMRRRSPDPPDTSPPGL